jgi:hypothetical protein
MLIRHPEVRAHERVYARLRRAMGALEGCKAPAVTLRGPLRSHLRVTVHRR